MMKPITMRKFRGYFFLAVSAILLGSCAGLPSNLDALKSRESAAQPIDAKTAARYALYGMMAANAYHDPSPIHFPLERLGWELVDLNGNGTDKPSFEDECLPYGTGLAYDIYRHSDGKRVVFAFRGTDDPVCDWTMANLAWISAAQYDKAERHFNDYLAAHLDSRVVMLTGHSLGGGLALSQSIRHGIEAAAFDSSPNANSLLLDKPIRPAERVLIYQKGEILEKPRDAAMPAGFSKIVPEENVYETKYDFGKMDLLSSNPVYLHSSGPLALGLLRQGAKIDPDLEGFCKAIGCRDKALLETAPVITANPIDLSLFNRIALASLSASERKDPQGDFRIAEHLEGETQCLASGEAGSTPPGWDGLVADLENKGILKKAADGTLPLDSAQRKEAWQLLVSGRASSDIKKSVNSIFGEIAEIDPDFLAETVAAFTDRKSLSGLLEGLKDDVQNLPRSGNEPQLLTNTLGKIKSNPPAELASETANILIRKDNRTLRLAIIAYARMNGINITEENLDDLSELLDSDEPNLYPLLHNAVATLKKEYGGDDAALGLQKAKNKIDEIRTRQNDCNAPDKA